MTSDREVFAVRAIGLAVRGAMIAMCAAPIAAFAADSESDAEVKALVTPTNYVEIGAINVSGGTAKFGEYNGLDRSHPYFLGNFGLRGGDSYGLGDGTTRWEVTGTDLGTTARGVGALISSQGKWSVSVGYDQLRHDLSDTYQTPYQGATGSNAFILAPTFGVINTAGVGTRSLTGAQLGAFHNQPVYTDRQNATFGAGYSFDEHWALKFDFNHLDQDGAKLIGAGTDARNLTASGGFNYGGERIAILLTPTNYQTDNVNVALDWVGDRAHASVSYFASLFHDGNGGMSFSNPFVTGTASGTSPGANGFPVSTMSTPPSNNFHQLKLSGGYFFSPATKLIGSLSYGRNTQDQSYAGTFTPNSVALSTLPRSSLDGLVVSEHADAKLTHQATRNLVLSAGLKYNERDNRTDSFSYQFFDIGTTPAPGAARTVVNTPMSNKKSQVELAADYRINKAQSVHVAYDYEDTKRWCNNALANNAQGVLSATNAGYYTDASCVQVPEDKENKLGFTYKLKAADTVNVNAGYAFADRKATVNPAFYNPMQADSEGFENFGYVAYFDASRKEHIVKASVNWQATDKLNLSVGGRYTKDDYDTTLGVQNGSAASLNLDATYSISEDSTLSMYANALDRKRELFMAAGRNAVAPLPNHWTNDLTDKDNTLGLGAKQKGLLKGRLTLTEDLTYSLSKTGYSTQVQYTLATCTPTSNLSCGSLPDIKSELIQFRLAGNYKLDKASSINVGYWYQHLKSNDYFYNIYQYGFTPSSLLPSNQQDGSYSVNLVYVSYSYTF